MFRYHLTQSEVDLINLFRDLPASDRERVVALLQGLCQENNDANLAVVSTQISPVSA